MDDRFFKGDKYKDSPADLGAISERQRLNLIYLLSIYSSHLLMNIKALHSSLEAEQLIDEFMEENTDAIYRLFSSG